MNSNTRAGAALGCLGLLLIGTMGPCCFMLLSAPGGGSWLDGSMLIYAIAGFPLLLGVVALVGGIAVFRKGRREQRAEAETGSNDAETGL